MLAGSGALAGRFVIEHGGILISGAPAIWQVLFMVPKQQFAAARPVDPIAACKWALAILASHLTSQSEPPYAPGNRTVMLNRHAIVMATGFFMDDSLILVFWYSIDGKHLCQENFLRPL